MNEGVVEVFDSGTTDDPLDTDMLRKGLAKLQKQSDFALTFGGKTFVSAFARPQQFSVEVKATDFWSKFDLLVENVIFIIF